MVIYVVVGFFIRMFFWLKSFFFISKDVGSKKICVKDVFFFVFFFLKVKGEIVFFFFGSFFGFLRIVVVGVKFVFFVL